MHALVEWTDEEKVSVISLTRVKEPRKDFGLYNLGEVVKASCHGFPGVHSAKILSIRGNLIKLFLKHFICYEKGSLYSFLITEK